MIPKIIHYCWLSDNPIPEKLEQCMTTWKDKLIDYEFIKWDLNRFNLDDSKWVREAFLHKKYAFAADFIRLYAVYQYGGVYLDMDIEVLKDFEPLLDKTYMLAYESKESDNVEAGCFGFEKGNQYLNECLSYYDKRSFIKDDGTLDTKPLPIIMKEVMKAGNYDFDLYDYDYFTVKSYQDGSINITNNSYAIHHFEGSWMNEKLKMVMDIKQKVSSKSIIIRIIGRLVIIPYAIGGLIEERGFGGCIKYYIDKIRGQR